MRPLFFGSGVVIRSRSSGAGPGSEEAIEECAVTEKRRTSRPRMGPLQTNCKVIDPERHPLLRVAEPRTEVSSMGYFADSHSLNASAVAACKVVPRVATSIFTCRSKSGSRRAENCGSLVAPPDDAANCGTSESESPSGAAFDNGLSHVSAGWSLDIFISLANR